MSWFAALSRLFRPEKPAPEAERIGSAGPTLRYISRFAQSEVVVPATQVLELWYDYNPFGWMHANSWRVVYLAGRERRHLDVFDQEHLKAPFRAWLETNFPAEVARRFDALYGQPGGDDESILVWSAEAAPTARGAA